VSFTDVAGNAESLAGTSGGTVQDSADTVVTLGGLTGGNAVQGTAVTATVTDGGSAVTGATYTFKVAGTSVQSSASNSYTPVEADEGKALTVDVSFTDVAGNAESLAGTSAGTVNENPNENATFTVSGLVNGHAVPNHPLTATVTEPDAPGSGITYTWKVNGVTTHTGVDGAGNTYTPQPGDTAKTLTLTVSFTDTHGFAETGTGTVSQVGGSPVYDFNGDGKSDLLFQHPNGTPQIWLMNGTSIISETQLVAPPPQWKIVTSADFNGDGLSDILWINTNTNQPAIWEMNGTSIISAVGLAAPPPSWHIAGAGDLFGSGDAAIIWQNSDGTPAVWQMNGTSLVSAVSLPNPGPAWKIAATGDFNGDGKTDLLWINTVSNQPAIWEMNGDSIVSAVGLTPQPANMEIIGTGDFSGNGDADILWLNTATNAPTIWLMNGTSVSSMTTLAAPPPSWRLVGTSDVYGTGMADILWQNANGVVSVWQMNGTSLVSAIDVGSPGNPGGGWQLNNNDPPLPSAADTTTAANGGNGTTRLSMPDAANAAGASATARGGLPDPFSTLPAGGPAALGARMAGAGSTSLPSAFADQLGGGGVQFLNNTTVASSLHVGSG
jgi:hypothetical protein